MSEAERYVPNAAHETKEVSGRFIAGAVTLLVSALALVTGGVLFFFPLPHLDRTLPSVMPEYPQPQLQPSPRADMARFYVEENRRLNGTGWVDRAHGIAHIPIDEAMREIAREGIPGWPSSQEASR